MSTSNLYGLYARLALVSSFFLPMPAAVRFLLMNSNSTPSPPPDPLLVNTDVVVILVAFLCAVVSVSGLAFVARCACPRRSFLGRGEAQEAPPDKGLKKKDLRALPKVAYGSAAAAGGAAECAICLTEFEVGDELRVLPQCGHVFHAECVDTWLAFHSSCPSCRRVLVVVSPPSR